MNLNNKVIFLAGSTGVAGSSIIKHLLERYPAVHIRAVCHKTKPFIRHKQVEYVWGDLRLRDECRRLVTGCDCAIMAAANTAGAVMLKSQPWRQINDNVTMNAQMLEAFHSGNVKRVVYIGSASLYQECEVNISEDKLDLNKDPSMAHFGIGWVVRFIEKLCRFWHKQYGIEIVIVRAANIFGPFDKFDPETSHFIPALIRKGVDKMNPFKVWGSPDVTRDVVYSEDFARAIVMLLDNDKIKFDTFNIGSAVRTTVGDIVNWVLKYAPHKPSAIEYRPDKPTTIKFRALNCTKARELLGWEPKYTIEDGVRKTTKWWIENKDWWRK